MKNCKRSERLVEPVQHVIIRPNRSLSLRGMIWLFIAYLGLLLIIALGFLGVGAWMVLPFAGLEAVVIGAVFYFFVYRHTNDHEVVIVDGDRLSVIKQEGQSQSRHEFQRHWTQVNLESSGHRWYPPRLLLGSHGRFVELGAGIKEEDKLTLAKELITILGRMAYK